FMIVDSIAGEWAWTIDDETAPETSIITHPPAEIPLETPILATFSSSEPDADYECALYPETPGGPIPATGAEVPTTAYSSCASADLPTADLGTPEAGQYRLFVRAVDPVLNVDPTPAVANFTVVGPPLTTILTGPPIEPATTHLRTATFTFEANQSQVTFMCSLDGLDFIPCSSPQTYSNLTFESHTFAVQATNPRWVVEGSSPVEYVLVEEPPVEYAWTIALPEGAIEPSTDITLGPLDGTTSQTATFHFTSDLPGSTFQCKLNGGPLETCASPKTYTGLANTGVNPPHRFQVYAVSSDGFEDTTPELYEWSVDLAPDTYFESAPQSLTTDTIASFVFGSNDGDAHFECALDSVAFGSCSNPEVIENLLPGQHEVWARAVDLAGNVDPTPVVHRWTIGARPNAAITKAPPELSTSSTATFEFTSDIPGNQGITFECAIDEMVEEEIYAPCTSPKTYDNLLFGEHEFAVRAVDAAGNRSEFPAEYGWQIGGEAPPVLITSEPWINDERRNATFEFTANGSNLTYQCALDNGNFSPCRSPKTYNGLPLGSHVFEVQVLVDPDNVINEPPITTYIWNVIESKAPETTISFGPADIVGTAEGGALDADVGFFFSSNESLSTFECALDG
ncbi:MAG TPA: hypothetical protein VGZ51_07115, partial [Actinomycetota bacterium]|nr:hypothetical protein [Actinomycetota bacterium]